MSELNCSKVCRKHHRRLHQNSRICCTCKTNTEQPLLASIRVTSPTAYLRISKANSSDEHLDEHLCSHMCNIHFFAVRKASKKCIWVLDVAQNFDSLRFLPIWDPQIETAKTCKFLITLSTFTIFGWKTEEISNFQTTGNVISDGVCSKID